MKALLAIITTTLFAIPLSLNAHTNLSSSVPADGGQVREVAEIQLVFSAAVKLTTFKLMGADGAEVTVGSIPADTTESHTISVGETLPPGRYHATWRSISADSHVVNGEIRFIVTD